MVETSVCGSPSNKWGAKLKLSFENLVYHMHVFFYCNSTYKDIQYTTLLELLTLLTTQYCIKFSFPFTHTEREKKKESEEISSVLHLYFRYLKILQIAIK